MTGPETGTTMSQVIRQETVVFIQAILHGMKLTFLYDLIRIFRRIVRHSTLAVSAEDLLFWIVSGVLTFCFAFFRTNGVIRGYVAVGLILGVVFYHFSISPLIQKFCLFLKKRIEFAQKSRYNIFRKRRRGNQHGKKKKNEQR